MALIHTHYFFTYVALVRRDLHVIRQRLRGAFINAGVRLIVDVLEFGGLFPAMGVPEELISPLFIGSVALQLLFQGMAFSLRTIFDIRFTRFIDYRLTLPLPKRWLFASYVTYFCMEAVIITLPLFTIGILLLGKKFHIVSPNWFLFIVIYLMSLILYGVMFLGISLYYEFDWFMQNIWPRRLTFLLMLSPTFFVWHKAYAFAPNAAYSMLIIPLTYVAEGLRVTLIGGPEYIPAYICILALFIWISLLIWFTACGIKKRLDPV
jgi:hypothetical protein